jgi:hypothetical protein
MFSAAQKDSAVIVKDGFDVPIVTILPQPTR